MQLQLWSSAMNIVQTMAVFFDVVVHSKKRIVLCQQPNGQWWSHWCEYTSFAIAKQIFQYNICIRAQTFKRLNEKIWTSCVQFDGSHTFFITLHFYLFNIFVCIFFACIFSLLRLFFHGKNLHCICNAHFALINSTCCTLCVASWTTKHNLNHILRWTTRIVLGTLKALHFIENHNFLK